jgi:hypothetical protein
VDLEALRRGTVGTGEVCEIPGVGPVPVQVARDQLGEALLHLVITDGVDVTTVCRLGRHIPDSLRVALIERDRTCVIEGCGTALGLEFDHWQVEYANGGRVSLDNLIRLCKHHHRLKTTKGFTLQETTTGFRLIPPETPRRPKRPRKQTPRKRPPPPGDPPLFDPEE